MRVWNVFVPLVVLATTGCKDEKAPYKIFGAAEGLDPVSVVVNGTAYPRVDGAYPMPSSVLPTSIETLAFRYQTPCGAYDVPHELVKPKGGLREAGRVKPSAGAPRLSRREVVIDARGESKHEVLVGTQVARRASPQELGHGDQSWDKATLGVIFGSECAPELEVTFNGTRLGMIPGTPPAGSGHDSIEQDKQAIFVTPKAACYRVRQLAVELVDKRSTATMREIQAFDRVLRGPGVFHLPLKPDLYMQEPTKAFAPSGIYEVPCDGVPTPP